MAPLNQLRPGLTALWVGVLARAGLKGIAAERARIISIGDCKHRCNLRCPIGFHF